MSTRQTRMFAAFCFAAIAALVGVSAVSAQGGPGMGMGMGGQGVMGPAAVRELFKNLNLTDDDLDKLDRILETDEIDLVKAQNEITIFQTKVANLLLDPNPDMGGIEDAITKSLTFEKDVRMIQIKRQVAIRSVFGENRWQSILLLVREARMSERAGKFANSFSAKGLSAQEANRYSRLLAALRRIM